MQVHGVISGIVCASNGGCESFDINRSLAEGVVELSHEFSDAPLATLAMGIIAMQKTPYRNSEGNESINHADVFGNLGI